MSPTALLHRFDCASCTSAVDPEGLHPRPGWPHRCYVCGRRRWWPTHWLHAIGDGIADVLAIADYRRMGPWR